MIHIWMDDKNGMKHNVTTNVPQIIYVWELFAKLQKYQYNLNSHNLSIKCISIKILPSAIFCWMAMTNKRMYLLFFVQIRHGLSAFEYVNLWLTILLAFKKYLNINFTLNVIAFGQKKYHLQTLIWPAFYSNSNKCSF